MSEVVAVDIGGTHARFALAEVADGRVRSIHAPATFRTADHTDFTTAWGAFADLIGSPLPCAASLAFAGPIAGDMLRLTNCHWTLNRAQLAAQLGLEHLVVINDFGAVAHAVAQASAADFAHICGPRATLSEQNVVSIVGPGTGLGVAQLLRSKDDYRIVETEGGHAGFAPSDAFEDSLLARLRARFGRVSTERVTSGPSLREIHDLAASGAWTGEDRALWDAAIDGSSKDATAALDRFCAMLGSVAGDITLTHGATAVVLGGGLGARLAAYLPASPFAERFAAKGRFAALMRAMPVQLITMREPGLFGAAAAFAREHAR